MSSFNPKVWVAVIEWSEGEAPSVFVTTTLKAADAAARNHLRATWAEVPELFFDDAPAFMKDELDVSRGVAEWLTAFQYATTSPWVTITEQEVAL